MSTDEVIAPEWSTDQWLNSKEHHKLSDFRGKVVMLHAFQMLCPGCVSHALPQAQRVWKTFNHDDLVFGAELATLIASDMAPRRGTPFISGYSVLVYP